MTIWFDPPVASRTTGEDGAQKAGKRTPNQSKFVQSGSCQADEPGRETLVDHWITVWVTIALGGFSLVCFSMAIAKFGHALTLATQSPVEAPSHATQQGLSYLD